MRKTISCNAIWRVLCGTAESEKQHLWLKEDFDLCYDPNFESQNIRKLYHNKHFIKNVGISFTPMLIAKSVETDSQLRLEKKNHLTGKGMNFLSAVKAVVVLEYK